MDELTFQFISNTIAITIPLFFVAFFIGDPNSRRIILFFCWGTFAAALSYNINSLLGFSWENSQLIPLIASPTIEEICKALPVFLFLNRKKYPTLTKTIVFCAMASGIGFSIQESMYYFAISSREILDIFILVMRTLTTALMHGMTTASIGIGLLIISKKELKAVPITFGLLVCAIALHALYNLLIQTNLMVLGMLMPIAMFVGGWIILQKLEPNQDR